MEEIDLKQAEFYLNRDLSLLEFNDRVLAQARDESVPLLERLRYLCISSTNLDEFFEVRYASLIQKTNLGTSAPEIDGVAPTELLKMMRKRSCELVQEQYRVLNDVLIPKLNEEGIRFLRRSEWTAAQEKWLHHFYEEELLPVLSPMGLDPAHPFPKVLNKSLNFIVSLTGKDAFGRNSGMAIVQAPRALPRMIQLPADEKGNGPHDFVFLSSVIHAFVDELFHGMNAKGCYQFRVTRNSDLYVDEEEIDDLLHAVKGELTSRHYGDAVRLEITDECPQELVEYLMKRFHIDEEALFLVNGPVNLNRLQEVCDIVERPELKFPPFVPKLPPVFKRHKSIFRAIKKQDILLHHPFESFLPVVDLLIQAAKDPDVLSIKQTLYRTGPNSTIVNALVEAAKAGKEVTVVIELRARFDEEANVGLANRLQEVGAHVLYGVVGYKTHAKMMVIVRREGKQLRHYVHLGTGNYHASTARFYTDYGFMTCNKVIGEDVQKVFNQLTSLGKVIKLDKLLQSPFTLFDSMIRMIDREITHAQAGKPARIIAKMNGLVEPQIIQALYRASMAGVQIDLIVRGMCCLRPGVSGVSENIRVRSIIGRFLEHTRVFYFENKGSSEIFAGSADWMERNLFRRVETCFPIESKKLKDRVIQELQYYLQDNSQAWLLQEDGSYRLAERAEGEDACSAQQTLLETIAG